MSLLDENEDLEQFQRIEVRRKKTDKICFHFSWPIFAIIIQIFIFVLYFGHNFSFDHPADKNGLRCGVNNAIYGKGLSDFRNYSILSYNGECIDDCDENKFLSYCIPDNITLLKHMDVSFKLAADYYKYFSFATSIIVFMIIIAIPIYLLLLYATSAVSIILFVATGLTLLVTALLSYFTDHFALGIIIAVFGSAFLFCTVYLYKQSKIIGQIIYESFQILKRNKSLLLAPILVFLLVFLAVMFSIFGIIFSKSVCDPILENGHIYLKQHKSMIITTILFPAAGIWFIEFVFLWVKTAIAIIISSEYFQENATSFPAALALIANFHSGTMFLGSLLVLILEHLSNFFNLIRKTMNTTKSVFVKFICICILKSCFCCIQLFGSINKYSYVYTAVKGVSFWEGCNYAANALDLNSIFTLEKFLNNLFLCVRLLLSLITLIAVFIYQIKIELLIPSIPIIWIPLTVYLALASLDITICTATETVILCLCEDGKSNGFYGPKDLENAAKWIREKISKDSFSPPTPNKSLESLNRSKIGKNAGYEMLIPDIEDLAKYDSILEDD